MASDPHSESAPFRPVLTIGIKALNEERHIAAAIESALAAAAEVGGEVVLADSGSRDATIAIAQAYPIRIVQLANIDERCCGAGAQLAFQQAQGQYFCLIDGDMVMQPGFVAAAIAYLKANGRVAGVGGQLEERNIANAEFAIRAQAATMRADLRAGIVDRLDGGGLYRTAAIAEVGYFADRNLHAFEEIELAARLSVRGWQLARIDRLAVHHYGHTETSFALLWRRFRSGYAGASGEVLRAALGRPHLGVILRRLGHIRNSAVVMIWWLVILAMLIGGAPALWIIGLIAVPLLLLIVRRGSLSLALYSAVQWNIQTVALIGGLFRRRTPAGRPLDSIEIPTAARTAP